MKQPGEIRINGTSYIYVPKMPAYQLYANLRFDELMPEVNLLTANLQIHFIFDKDAKLTVLNNFIYAL